MSTFLFAKMLHALCGCIDVVLFESLTLTPFCLEKNNVRKIVF